MVDKKGSNVNDGRYFTVNLGSYRITVVPMYRHRYTYPFTVTKEITVKPMKLALP